MTINLLTDPVLKNTKPESKDKRLIEVACICLSNRIVQNGGAGITPDPMANATHYQWALILIPA
ncbi:MAG: hypothetical protein Q8N35_09725 [Methylococcaceae bacterium]|nr:hypothetical protein [Methylococcaceae bacterium]MDZ4156252.1 hypothetical protein [Methylococcales bacterium]MDP2393831.1 hypothetical protein [Methylococcaceae bacterium]MDP3019857.1 hypothetical protein [Methylococcaceae bacterium]MDP3389538.1 hypothetical protein [Methylococcaceae bacterium]